MSLERRCLLLLLICYDEKMELFEGSFVSLVVVMVMMMIIFFVSFLVFNCCCVLRFL